MIPLRISIIAFKCFGFRASEFGFSFGGVPSAEFILTKEVSYHYENLSFKGEHSGGRKERTVSDQKDARPFYLLVARIKTIRGPTRNGQPA